MGEERFVQVKRVDDNFQDGDNEDGVDAFIDFGVDICTDVDMNGKDGPDVEVDVKVNANANVDVDMDVDVNVDGTNDSGYDLIAGVDVVVVMRRKGYSEESALIVHLEELYGIKICPLLRYTNSLIKANTRMLGRHIPP